MRDGLGKHVYIPLIAFCGEYHIFNGGLYSRRGMETVDFHHIRRPIYSSRVLSSSVRKEERESDNRTHRAVPFILLPFCQHQLPPPACLSLNHASIANHRLRIYVFIQIVAPTYKAPHTACTNLALCHCADVAHDKIEYNTI